MESDEQLSKKILGAWDERKHITFLADGTWRLQKNEDDAAAAGTFTWSIHDGELIQIRDGRQFVYSIKSLTATQLVIQRDDGGKPEVHTRGQVAPLPFPQVVSKGTVFPPDAEIVEGALNAVYSALRSRLDPAAKEQLKEEELRWLRTRETIKHNTDSYMIKGTVENLTEFTVLRIMMLKYQLANAER